MGMEMRVIQVILGDSVNTGRHLKNGIPTCSFSSVCELVIGCEDPEQAKRNPILTHNPRYLPGGQQNEGISMLHGTKEASTGGRQAHTSHRR